MSRAFTSRARDRGQAPLYDVILAFISLFAIAVVATVSWYLAGWLLSVLAFEQMVVAILLMFLFIGGIAGGGE